MSHAKWLAAIVVIVALGSSIPSAQASLIQIDDLTDTLVLYVDGVPVTGNGGRISGYLNTYDGVTETLQFTFMSDVQSAVDFKQYTRMNGDGEGPSDIFLITGTADSNLFDITFLSSDLPSVLVPPSGFDFSVYDPLVENGLYQTVFKLTPDEYQARSDIPEPSTCLMLGTGLLGLYGWLRRKRIA
jgi:hypothetical protein